MESPTRGQHLRCFPTVVILTTGKVHDVNILDDLSYAAGSFYIVDRGYLDFGRLHRVHLCGAFFVTRPKKNSRFQRRYSRPVDNATGLRFDQTVVLTGFRSHQQFPDALRRIGFRDPQTGKRFVFLPNNFTEPALTIAQLYRCRWQIELFFKEISLLITDWMRKPAEGIKPTKDPNGWGCTSRRSRSKRA